MRERSVELAEAMAMQSSNNLVTDGNWDCYAEHRARVTALLLAALSSQPSVGARVAVLGAGNCNDLELAAVSEQCSELHLFDYDEAAMIRGLERQRLRPGKNPTGRIVVHGGVELTGLARDPASAGKDDARGMAEKALAGPVLPAGDPFDVVVSATLLSQLISLPVALLGADSPDLNAVVLAVRNGHLRLLARLLRPGGAALLLTDVVSSDTLPELRDASDDSLAVLLDNAVVGRNFFTGTNPYALTLTLSQDPVLNDAVDSVWRSGPWRWQMGPSRCYLVVAHSFRRAGRLAEDASARRSDA